VTLSAQAGLWGLVEILASSPSTNQVVADRARAGAHEGLVVVAEHQTAGRGRLDRTWVTPPKAALTLSVLLTPTDVPAQRWPWLPLLTGVAVARAVRRVGGPAPTLKWPNDVLMSGRKLAGILIERVERVDRPDRPDRPDGSGGSAAVVGIGMNVSTTSEELPASARATATSLLLEGVTADRDLVLSALLEELAGLYMTWRDCAGEPEALRAAYLAVSGTVGTQVRVELPGGAHLVGDAVDVDEDGRLVVAEHGRRHTLAAGDVVHLRPLPQAQS
jgi:BirA family transcriptional regulator, biotin operon repressor / biotin---[acetyl-CoA-carboxylase] ligase